MKNNNKLTAFLSALLLFTISAHAQIYSSGEDQGSLKWRTFRTKEFQLIYPDGLDSLAHQYAHTLEYYRRAVGRSIGVEPNQRYRKPMPVILHQDISGNGMVAWAPHRMELYTGPDAFSPDAMEWMTNLGIHESRHVAQMQMGRSRTGYKIFNTFFGEGLPGLMSGLYPGPHFLEGDAVVAETGLTDKGRGRSADFLEYYMAAFSEGDMRDWHRWRYGSYKYFTPDYYKLGYLTIAGTRSLYDAPTFSADYFSNISSSKLLFPMFVMNKTLKETSGMKLKKTWKAIAAAQDSIWRENMAARGPFTEAQQVTASHKRFTEYQGTTKLGEELFTIQYGINTGYRLAKIDKDGEIRIQRPFSGRTSSLMASEATGRIYWSETTPDLRWTLKESSRIRYIDAGRRRIHTLTNKGKLYNPAPSPDGSVIAAADYPTRGGSAIRIISATDGHDISVHRAPDSLQVVESAWLDGHLFATAISPAGFGIYDVDNGYTTLLAPQPTKIKQLRSGRDGLYFVSDRLGVNELYRIGSDGRVFQMTNNKLGASEFVLSGDSLYFSALTAGERAIYKEKMAQAREVDYTERYRHPFAEKISEQERQLAAADLRPQEKIEYSEPKDYHKLPHLFRFHTWTPLYTDVDAISDLSFETIMNEAGYGAMGMFQNSLGTAVGSIGYSLNPVAPSELTTKKYINALHARFTYSGRFPVFELKLDVSDKGARDYHIRRVSFNPQRSSNSMTGVINEDRLSVSGSAKVYIPFNFSSGGWSRGIIPQVSLSMSNDFVNTTIVDHRYVNMVGEKGSGAAFFAGTIDGHTVPFSKLTANVRGYAMTSIPHSNAYPRWGIGAETGASLRPGMTKILTPDVYGYLYGYVPGILPSHGIRMSLMTQYQMDAIFREMYAIVVPRGFLDMSNINKYIQARYPAHMKLSVDYSLPLINLDWSGLGPVAYVKNIELRPHFDISTYGGSGIYKGCGLFSVGSEMAFNLGNLAWIPYDTRIGVSYSYNGGNAWENMIKNGASLERHRIEFIFSVDM